MNLNLLNQKLIHPLFLGSLILLPWTFIFALPIAHFGIWIDVEGIAFAQSLLSSIICLTFGVIQLDKPDLSFAKPTLYFLAIAFLGIIFLPLHNLKDLSWFGHPEGGIGIWFFLQYGWISLALSNIHQKESKILIINILVVSWALILLSLLFHPSYFGRSSTTWVIMHFPGYLIWVSIACLFLAALGQESLKGYFLTAAIAELILSGMRTAWISVIALLATWFFLGKLKSLHLDKEKTRKYILYAIPFISLLTLTLIASLTSIETLHSRFVSLKIALLDLWQHPSSFLFGMGFGQMSDSIIRQLLNAEQWIFDQNGAYVPSWEGIGRFDSSSMNQFIDMTMGIGAIGAVLLFFIFTSLYREKSQLSEGKKLLLFLATGITLAVSSMWFTMISSFPIFLLAIALLSERKQISLKVPRLFIFLTSMITAVALFITSSQIYRTGVFYSQDLKSSIPIKLATASNLVTAQTLNMHKGPAGIHLAFWTRSILRTNDHNFDLTLEAVLLNLFQNPEKISLTLAENLLDLKNHFPEQKMFADIINNYSGLYPSRPDLFPVQS